MDSEFANMTPYLAIQHTVSFLIHDCSDDPPSIISAANNSAQTAHTTHDKYYLFMFNLSIYSKLNGNIFLHFLKGLFPDSADILQILDTLKRTVLCPVINDFLCSRRSDSADLLKCRGICCVNVDFLTRSGYRCRQRFSGI